MSSTFLDTLADNEKMGMKPGSGTESKGFDLVRFAYLSNARRTLLNPLKEGSMSFHCVQYCICIDGTHFDG